MTILPEAVKRGFSEQDTADKLILPYLNQQYGFPSPDSLDYQAQHSIPTDGDRIGRYDGLYLHGGYPYVIMEAKKYDHELINDDLLQARRYALSDVFERPVPFIVISNGREYLFYKKGTELDQDDGKIAYLRIPEIHYDSIITDQPGKIRILLTADQLLKRLQIIKNLVYSDIKTLFYDNELNQYNLDLNQIFKNYLEKIIKERKIYIGTTSNEQKQIEFAIQSISLHFTINILFIKIIEDLSSGQDIPRIIHNLFPREEYNLMGGVFGYKVLNFLNNIERNTILRLYLKSKKFYSQLGQDIARISYQDIFRYGFNVHMVQYGKILKAENYDKFFPSENTLKQIRDDLITIDIRSALIYGNIENRYNVIGDIYGKLIDSELRDSIGAVYTPDDTVDFMVNLAQKYLQRLRGKKIVENACGSGHFYRQLYRRYVDEVVADNRQANLEPDYRQAHSEALEHVLGRDIDPFAIQLTILGVFLEELKDNVKALSIKERNKKQWKANYYIDCQNSLDPITVKPDEYFDVLTTRDIDDPKSLLLSCKKAFNPNLVIGNPPYGVKVVKSDHYDDIYHLQSKDSYGYFISNAIQRLSEGNRVIFITSSSFLTIQSHYKLREYILDNCKIVKIVKLHRNTFPGIDIFPVIIEFERCSDEERRNSNIYQFYDLWQLHPIRYRDELISAYKFILNDDSASIAWPFNKKRINRYTVRQGVINICSLKPIFDGMPSIFSYMDDIEKYDDPTISLANTETNTDEEVRVKFINNVNIAKLKRLAIVKAGLQTGDNKKYIRKTEGSPGNYEVIQDRLIRNVTSLTNIEKENGIIVNDPDNDPHFIAYDKAGAIDIEGQLLKNYYYSNEYFID